MLADEVCSTEKMVTFCRESPAREIIVVTEAGLLHRLRKEIPDKTFIPGPTDNCFCGECRFMKMNTLEKAHDALLNMEPEITLPEPLRKRAELPILRMLELSKVAVGRAGRSGKAASWRLVEALQSTEMPISFRSPNWQQIFKTCRL